MIRVTPSASFEATLDGAPSGLVGTIGVRIIDNNGSTITGRTTAGIVEDLAGSGTYTATLSSPGSAGPYTILWDTGGALTPANTAEEDLIVDPVAVNCYAVQAGAAFKISASGPTGLAGTIGYRIVNGIGGTTIPRTTAGIAEYPAGSGVYHASVPAAPGAAGRYAIVWDTGVVSPTTVAADDLVVITAAPPATSSGGEGIPHSLFLCGQEVINPARALGYMLNLNPGHFVNVSSPSELPQILFRMRGAVETFSDPITDAAPWYDPAYPESANFLGVLIDTVTGLDSTISRSVTAQGTGGGVLGRSVEGPRQMLWSGWLVADAYCGIEYGKRWLIDTLKQQCDPNNPCDATLRLCAPPDDASNDDLGRWVLYRTGLISGPFYVETDKCPDLAQVTFTLAAERPEFSKIPVECLPDTVLWPSNTPGGACVDFCDWFAGVGGPINSCTITPPRTGKICPVITISADTVGVGPISVGRWAMTGAAPSPSTLPDYAYTIPFLPAGATLVIDSARKQVIYTAPDGVVTDGFTKLDFPTDSDGNLVGFTWFEVDDCDPATSIGVQVTHQCGGGAYASVEIATVLKQL